MPPEGVFWRYVPREQENSMIVLCIVPAAIKGERGWLIASARTGSVLTADGRIGGDGPCRTFPTWEAAEEHVCLRMNSTNIDAPRRYTLRNGDGR